MAPDVLNHGENTNKQYYQTYCRGKMVAAAKKSFFEQCTPAKKISSRIALVANPEAPVIQPRKSSRQRNAPKFIVDNFLCN